MRKAVLNRLRDEVRRAARRPDRTDLDGTELDPAPTPLEDALGRELATRYDFKGSKAEVSFEQDRITLVGDDEFRLKKARFRSMFG